jgi:hypothetical protein
VALVEFTGDALLIHLEVQAPESGGGADPLKLTSKSEATAKAHPGDVCDVNFRRTRIHWFDGQTGERLPAAPCEAPFPPLSTGPA